MCGIVGVFSRGAAPPVTEGDIVRMRDRMASRGPDDCGVNVLQADDTWVGLGHRRLSILDLSPAGHQPMCTADGRLWIVYNGEVFNFRELRSELESRGKYCFRSQTDTEVILYGMEEWGLEGCLRRLRGMYAFALYDCDAHSLTLVRDPLGVKPLYYLVRGEVLAFASEIKALLEMPGVPREINESALYHYLTFANSPAPDTLFRSIWKLEAGTYLVFNGNKAPRKVKYWDPTARCVPDYEGSEQECASEVLRLLRQAVCRRMVADVPVGVFLSGGVDSSLNVALMAEISEKPVETFSIGIAGDPTNEFQYARVVAEHFKANHHEIVIDKNDFFSFYDQMAYLQDEPLADPVCVPLYYVSRLASHWKTPVIQVGEGSDEIFSGYSTHHLFDRLERRLYRQYSKLPSFVKRLIEVGAYPIVPDHILGALSRATRDEPLFIGNAIAFWDNEKEKLLRRKLSDETSGNLIKRFLAGVDCRDTLLRIEQTELYNRLPELLLMRVDKMSMANSIETRVPFLDEDLVEFALRIPSTMKWKNGQSKYVLKRVAEKVLPREVVYRKKGGFCGSATNMIDAEIARYAHARIMRSELAKEYFNKNFVDILFRRHKRQPRFNSFKIWNLLNLVLWYDCWFGSTRTLPMQ